MASLSRRHFVGVATLGTAGMALSSVLPASAFSFVLLDLLGEFAFAVGSALAARFLGDYIEQHLQGNDAVRRQIVETNNGLRSQGFQDLAYSNVYHHPENFYYPVVYREWACLNYVTPVFSVTCGCQPVTFIQGPHMAGLAAACRQLSRQENSAGIRSILFPARGLQIAVGNFTQGYRCPLIYESEVARVAVDYKPTSPASGIVGVQAVGKGLNGSVFVNNGWSVQV